MIGNKYGRLTVTDMYRENNKTFCICDCDCGNKGIKRNSYKLRNSSEFASCGCSRKEVAEHYLSTDVEGMKYGKLTILETLWGTSPLMVKCKCDCGTIGNFRKNDVQTKHTTSCGCVNREKWKQYNTVNDTGYISDSGIEILSVYKK